MNKSLIVPKTNLTIELFDWFLACISYLEYWLNLSFKGAYYAHFPAPYFDSCTLLK